MRTSHADELRELGWRFHHHRVAQGFSLTTVAKQTGMSIRQLRTLERGEYDAPFMQLQALLDALDLQWTDIWGTDLPPRRRIHELPIESDAWHAIASMLQPFDIRVDIHRIHAGDHLELHEVLHGQRTGRVLRRVVTYTIPQVSLGLTPGHIALALRPWELSDEMTDATGGLPFAVTIRRSYRGQHEVVSNVPGVHVFIANFDVSADDQGTVLFPDPAKKGRDVPATMHQAVTTYDPAFVAACFATTSDRIDGQLTWITSDDLAANPNTNELSNSANIPPLTVAQQHELEKRLRAYEADPEAGRSWEVFEKELKERDKPLVICERIEDGERRYYSNTPNAEIFFVREDLAGMLMFADPHAGGRQKRVTATRVEAFYDPIVIAALRAAQSIGDGSTDDN